MTVLQAIKPNIYTLRTLRSDESAGYITLGRASDLSASDTDGDDLRSAKSDGRLFRLIRAYGRYASAHVHRTKCDPVTTVRHS
jgi:hypothetical protein